MIGDLHIKQAKSPHLADSGGYLLFMLAVSVFALLILGSEVILDLTPSSRVILDYADNTLCGLFFIDFCISLWRAENRWRYFVRWGWLDLLSSIPTIDAFRITRLARVLRIVRVLRAVKAAKILVEFILRHRAKNALLAMAFIAMLLVVFASIGMLHFETVPESNIKTPQDAMWWAMQTLTTVGYGDLYPVTPEGRALAAALMVCGVGLIGVFTGFVAYWFMRPSEARKDDLILAMSAQIAQLQHAELQSLREEIQQLRKERDRLKQDMH
jgi:voltage-gated potassium channel